MTTFRDKFHDPRWLAKREEVLERAGGECEYCRTTEDLQVHVSYWEQGVEPWAYPLEAYRCLCRSHREMRTAIERDIKKEMARLGEDALDMLHQAIKRLAAISPNEQAFAADQLYAFSKTLPRYAKPDPAEPNRFDPDYEDLLDSFS